MVKYDLDLYQEAIKDLSIAIELEPSFDVAYYIRGLIKYDLGLYKEAIKDYTRAIELKFDGPVYPKLDEAEAYYNRGKAKESLDLRKEAQEDYAIAEHFGKNLNNDK